MDSNNAEDVWRQRPAGLVVPPMQTADYVRPEGCVCPLFRDVFPFRIADLTCPVHGVSGTDPGDGEWEVAR